MTDTKLDCRGLRCPEPIIRLFTAIRELETGDRLVIEATDPAFQPDLEAWIASTGHALEEYREGEVKTAIVRKQDAQPA